MSDYLSSFREDQESVYYLNKNGREYVESNRVLRKTQFVNHVLMRNEFYIFAGKPHKWQPETKIVEEKSTIICDVLFISGKKYHFLEVDSTQQMSENRVKARYYLNMYQSKALEKQLGYFPTLIWLTTTEYRRKQLEKACKDFPCKVYTMKDIR